MFPSQYKNNKNDKIEFIVTPQYSKIVQNTPSQVL